MDRIPKPGECYRHFKNKLYQVVTVATHTETSERMVVYQALYGTYKTYVRPLSMFLSEVDHERYPDAKQRYRFEKVETDQLTREDAQEDFETKDQPEGRQSDCESDFEAEQTASDEEAHDAPSGHENLFAFLDADGYQEKLDVLRARKNRFTRKELINICETLDLKTTEDTAEGLYHLAEDHLSMQIRFDGARLR